MFLIDMRLKKGCNKAILENVRKLESVPECCPQKICNQAVDNYAHYANYYANYYNLFWVASRLKNCVIKLTIVILLQYNYSSWIL